MTIMGNRSEHAIFGALAALTTYGLYKLKKEEKPTIQGALGSLLVGAFAGVLPDLLEPASHPTHRSFFHSFTLLMMLMQGNLKTWEAQNLTEDQKLVISLLSAGYGSHLLSDSSTPRSIPFLV